MMHKVALFGTLAVVAHAIVSVLHGLVHLKLQVPLSLFQNVVVVSVIGLAPICRDAFSLDKIPLRWGSSPSNFNGRGTGFRRIQPFRRCWAGSCFPGTAWRIGNAFPSHSYPRGGN